MKIASIPINQLAFNKKFEYGVGDKLMEINVFSPGGLGSSQMSEKVNFSHEVLHTMEWKVEHMSFYRRNFDNDEMALL